MGDSHSCRLKQAAESTGTCCASAPTSCRDRKGKAGTALKLCGSICVFWDLPRRSMSRKSAFSSPLRSHLESSPRGRSFAKLRAKSCSMVCIQWTEGSLVHVSFSLDLPGLPDLSVNCPAPLIKKTLRFFCGFQFRCRYQGNTHL